MPPTIVLDRRDRRGRHLARRLWPPRLSGFGLGGSATPFHAGRFIEPSREPIPHPRCRHFAQQRVAADAQRVGALGVISAGGDPDADLLELGELRRSVT